MIEPEGLHDRVESLTADRDLDAEKRFVPIPRRPKGRPSKKDHRPVKLIDRSRCPVTGKRQYVCEKSAEKTAKFMKKAGRAEDDTLHAYECRECGTWHVGHRRWLRGESGNSY